MILDILGSVLRPTNVRPTKHTNFMYRQGMHLNESLPALMQAQRPRGPLQALPGFQGLRKPRALHEGFAVQITYTKHAVFCKSIIWKDKSCNFQLLKHALDIFSTSWFVAIELRTNLQVIMSSHVIPCYPMSLVLVSRFNWFNVILCGLFFPAHLLHLKNFNLENFQEESHDLKPVTCITWRTASILPDEFLNVADLCPWEKYVEKPEAILQFPIDTKMLWHHVVPCKS